MYQQQGRTIVIEQYSHARGPGAKGTVVLWVAQYPYMYQ